MSLKSRLSGRSSNSALRTAAPVAGSVAEDRSSSDYLKPQFVALKARVQDALLARIEHPDTMARDELYQVISQIVENERDLPPLERDAVTRVLADEITGFGPLQPLLDDPDVSEIMVNGPHSVYIERKGQLERTAVVFRDNAHLKAVLEKMLLFTGRRVDEGSPMVDARLPDGSRLNAVIHPIAVHGDVITIRKFSRHPFSLAQLVERQTLSPEMARFLEAAVKGRTSLVVSGGTGSGKTTFLNALSAFIPASERIITIEDAAELQLQQEHCITLEARPANIEGSGAIPIRALVRNALRMRPDRIIVGEVRGGEALDMLQAMNTGHEGSLTTAHANSPRDCLSRLETMVLMAGADLPLLAIRQQIASAVELIVQVARLQDGSRRVVRITEVVGMEEGVITTQDLFVFELEGLDANGHVMGQFVSTGIRPHITDKLIRQGVEVGHG